MLFSLLERCTMTLCLCFLLSSTCMQQIGTTKHASVLLVWNSAEVSSQYFSQAPEGSHPWSWITVPTQRRSWELSWWFPQNFLKAAMQDITGSFSIPRAGQMFSLYLRIIGGLGSKSKANAFRKLALHQYWSHRQSLHVQLCWLLGMQQWSCVNSCSTARNPGT